MTTILYHNHMLLADSRSSSKSTHLKCAHCGEKAHDVNDKDTKIRIPEKTIMFQGEVIRAVSGSGNVNHTENQINMITSLEDYRAAYNTAFLMVGTAANTIRCTLMVVTDKRVHVVRYTEAGLAGLLIESYGLDETVTIGSGGDAAKAAIIAYKADAFEAMRVAALVDKSTGGPIRYVDFSSKEEKLKIQTYDSAKVAAVEPKQEESAPMQRPRPVRKTAVK